MLSLEHCDERWWNSGAKLRWAHAPPDDPPWQKLVGGAGSSGDDTIADRHFQVPKGKVREQRISTKGQKLFILHLKYY